MQAREHVKHGSMQASKDVNHVSKKSVSMVACKHAKHVI